MTVCLQLAQLQLGNLSQGTTAELGTPQSHFCSPCQRETLFQEPGSLEDIGMSGSPEEKYESLSRLVIFLTGVPCLAGKPNQEFLLLLFFQGNLYTCGLQDKFCSEEKKVRVRLWWSLCRYTKWGVRQEKLLPVSYSLVRLKQYSVSGLRALAPVCSLGEYSVQASWHAAACQQAAQAGYLHSCRT